jgi:hypothetical protein
LLIDRVVTTIALPFEFLFGPGWVGLVVQMSFQQQSLPCCHYLAACALQLISFDWTDCFKPYVLTAFCAGSVAEPVLGSVSSSNAPLLWVFNMHCSSSMPGYETLV